MNERIEYPLFAEERQEEIINLLKVKSKLTVPELCEYFNLSAATVRNDIRKLASQGRLRRTHGGIIPAGKVTFEPTTEYKQTVNIRKKLKIAQKASEMVHDGDTIILDTGTTTMELAKHLAKKENLTIIVNDVSIALFLENTTSSNVILLSGILRRGFHCTVGPWVTSALQNLNVDTAFLSTNSFSLTKGFMTPDIDQAEAKRAYIRAASQSVVLFDSSKIGSLSFISFATLDDIDTIITDNEVNEGVKSTLNGYSNRLNLFYV